MPDEIWNALDFEGERVPLQVWVWTDSETRKKIAHRKQASGWQISARELFLEAARDHIHTAIIHNEREFYIPVSKLKKDITRSKKKFTNLLEFLSCLPGPVRSALDAQLVSQLENLLRDLTKPLPDYPKLGANYFRSIFLNQLLREHQTAFGSPPLHTGDHPFKSVATELCVLAGFSGGNIQSDLASIKDTILKQ